MNKLVVLIKFNRTDLYITKKGYPTGMRFRKTLARREWWDNRLKILQTIVFPSLRQQTFQDFDIVAPFTTDIDRKLSYDLIDWLKGQGVYIWLDNRLLKDFVEPVPFLIEKYKDVDNLILLNLDSDDVYHKDAFKTIMGKQLCPGKVFIFRNGYVYDTPTNRLGIYTGYPSPPPFFAMTYTKEALQSQQAWDEYIDKYKMKVEHPHLNRCKVREYMPDGLFCYVFHDWNVTSSWDNSHHRKKIIEVDLDKNILSSFGISI